MKIAIESIYKGNFVENVFPKSSKAKNIRWKQEFLLLHFRVSLSKFLSVVQALRQQSETY